MPEGMPITPQVLTWARERAGYSMDSVRDEFRKIEKWEAGAELPSYPQLERLADKFKIPIAVFFFPDPPNLPPIEETFRTLGPDQIADIPPRIRLLLRKARTFQMSLEELNEGRNPAERLIVRDLVIRPAERVNVIAAKVRNYLGVSIDQQIGWSSVQIALEQWRQKLFEVGIYVFKDQFREPEYSGFCLYDDEFPIIYVNNTTAKTRQVFTLFHELAHLLFHTSGVDTKGDQFIEQLTGDPRRIEVICNRIAADILVPEESFNAAIDGREPTEETAIDVAERFSVSREFVFRKFLDRGLITAFEYESAARRWAEQIRNGNGGDHYNTKISYLGSEYVNLAFQRFYQNRLDFNQLAEILDTKPRNLSRLEEYVSRRAT